MDKQSIINYKKGFDSAVHALSNEGKTIEYWKARELQNLLGYSKWQNFSDVINKAILSCKNNGIKVEDHFISCQSDVSIGKDVTRKVDDYLLTKYACYMIAQNGDPQKKPIAFAQSYFTVQTRKMELIEQNLNEVERLNARERLTRSEVELSKNIYERGVDEQGFGRIRSKGDKALFGGLTTNQMKEKLGIKNKSRPLADYLPTVTILAKSLATEMTNLNVEKNDLHGESPITKEHVANNTAIRGMLNERGIKPESLPQAEDTKKLKRRVESNIKKISKLK